MTNHCRPCDLRHEIINVRIPHLHFETPGLSNYCLAEVNEIRLGV